MTLLSVSQIENTSLLTWPALETVADGHWRARFASGFSGRANSIWAMDPDDDADASGRLDTLSARYAQHDLPALFRVTPLTGPGILQALDIAGWEAIKSSLVLTMPIAQTQGFDGAASLYDATDPDFLAVQAQLNGFSPPGFATFTAILNRLESPACGIVLVADDGTPAASLLCVQTDGIVMFFDVVTAKSLRGRGFGRRMIATGLSWGAENGAAHAALQVQADNSAALALYLSMGFEFRYPYHYRRKPEAPAP